MSNHRTAWLPELQELPGLAAMFKALSNEHRLQIFLRLLDCCPVPSAVCCDEQEFGRCVGDLGRDLDIAASTVSHHIKELRQAGLIQLERDGRFVHCSVVPEAVEHLRGAFGLPAAAPDSSTQPSNRCTPAGSCEPKGRRS